MGYMRTHGPSLIAMGYAITPLEPLSGMGMAFYRPISIEDTQRYGEHDVSILTRCGAIPVTAIEINTTNGRLRGAAKDWCIEMLGAVPYRITPQSFTLFYRAATRGQGQRAEMYDGAGNRHNLIAKGSGEATAAFSNHPETYGHVLGSIASTPASTLRIVSIDSIERAMDYFVAIAAANGMKRVLTPQLSK